MPRRVRRRETLSPLAPVLAQTLHQAGLGRLALLGRITQHWHEIVGPQLAVVTSPVNLRRRVLFVAVQDAGWLQQLAFYHSQILRNIHQVLGDVPVTKVHCFLAPSSLSETSAQDPEKPSFVPLSAEEEQWVLHGTAHLADPELRAIVQQAWRRGWQRRREV